MRRTNTARREQNRAETQRTSEKKARFCAAQEVEEEPDLERDGFAKEEKTRGRRRCNCPHGHGGKIDEFSLFLVGTPRKKKPKENQGK